MGLGHVDVQWWASVSAGSVTGRVFIEPQLAEWRKGSAHNHRHAVNV